MSVVTTRNENWFRLGSVLYDAIVPALKTVLHNDSQDSSYTGLPRNESLLFKEFDTTYKPEINRLLAKRLLDRKQYAVLLPSSQRTNSDAFDATLTILLIRSLLQLPCSSAKWKYDEIQPSDVTIAASVIRSRELRNFICHNDPDAVDNQTFHDKWCEGERIVNDLKFTCDLQRLRTQPLDETSTTNTLHLISLEKRVLASEKDAKDALNMSVAASNKADVAENDAKLAISRLQIAESIANTSETLAKNADNKADYALSKTDTVHVLAINAEQKACSAEVSAKIANLKVDRFLTKFAEAKIETRESGK